MRYTASFHFSARAFLFLTTFFFLASYTVTSQPKLVWDARFNGISNGDDFGRAMKVDAQRNVYIAGSVVNTDSQRDFAVVKYNPDGQFVWVRFYNGDLNKDDWAHALDIDRNGYIYVAGFSQTRNAGKNYITMKCDPNGSILWTKEYDGPAGNDDVAEDIAVDVLGNVYVTGSSQGTGTLSDYATIKYDTNGIVQWVARYNGPGNGADDARAIAVDANGNVYISGGSTGDSTGYDFATIKYNHEGQSQWIARYNGPGNSDDIVYYKGSLAVDTVGNVYVTGYSTGSDLSYDYAIIKYDANGKQVWLSRFQNSNGGADYADRIAIDRYRNVYVTGGSYNGKSGYDFVTIKYDSDGVKKWTAAYNGTANDWDEAYAITIDSSQNVYIAGRSVGTGSAADIVIVKYDVNGSEVWNARYDQAKGYDWPFALAMDANENLYVGGYVDAFVPSSRGADFIVIKYSGKVINRLSENTSPIPFLLEQNYPNPFSTGASGSSRVTIAYSIPQMACILLRVYDAMGREVATLVNAEQEAGSYQSQWNVYDRPSGVYYYRIEIRSPDGNFLFMSRKKMILMR